MTTQSTRSLKGRLAGIMIVFIALPVLALAPAYLASRFTMQSPSPDNQASIQPSTPDILHEPVEATTNEATVAVDDSLTIELDNEGIELLRDSDIIRVTFVDQAGSVDFSGEVVLLDTQSDDDCVLTLRFADSTNEELDTFIGQIKIDDEIRSGNRNCGIFFRDGWESQ